MHEVALGLLLHSTYQVHKQYTVLHREPAKCMKHGVKDSCVEQTAVVQQRADGTQRRGSMLASDAYVIVITDIDLVAVDVVPDESYRREQWLMDFSLYCIVWKFRLEIACFFVHHEALFTLYYVFVLYCLF